MLDSIPPSIFSGVGSAALVGFIVVQVLTGALIPRWVHSERVRDKDTQITYLIAALDKRDEQVAALLENDNAIITLLESVRKSVNRGRQ